MKLPRVAIVLGAITVSTYALNRGIYQKVITDRLNGSFVPPPPPPGPPPLGPQQTVHYSHEYYGANQNAARPPSAQQHQHPHQQQQQHQHQQQQAQGGDPWAGLNAWK
ncbi:hypothetical protein B0T25DRAFT_569330 [Lasiosphaeria hispida]|uniref:Uncharacterized protein n=1 Tax=Lasiosphaeria hispida TaxID=260671 RepID=A0AAJ0MBN9_9PEZI|nr:hypothetical protein B0T25DRAFT_569330 [Lasiosphaeria hispida]